MHTNNGNRGNEEFVGQSTWQSCVFNTFASYGRDLKLCTERVTRTKVLKSLKLHRISSRFPPSSGENWSVTRWFFSSCFFFSQNTQTHATAHATKHHLNSRWPQKGHNPKVENHCYSITPLHYSRSSRVIMRPVPGAISVFPYVTDQWPVPGDGLSFTWSAAVDSGFLWFPLWLLTG